MREEVWLFNVIGSAPLFPVRFADKISGKYFFQPLDSFDSDPHVAKDEI